MKRISKCLREFRASPMYPVLSRSVSSLCQCHRPIGAVNELIAQLAARRKEGRPNVFVTGGAGRFVLPSLAREHAARYEPHLVLAGIALTQS